MPDEKKYTLDEEGNVKIVKEESKFDPIPADEYDLIIQNIETRTGKDSHEPYFSVEHSVVHNEEFENKRIWENVSPSAAWRVTQLVEAAYGPLDVEVGEEFEFNIFDLFGAEVRARVGLETGQDGVVRNNIVRYLPKGEGATAGALTSVKPPAATGRTAAKRPAAKTAAKPAARSKPPKRRSTK